jgi:hypothetical protein
MGTIKMFKGGVPPLLKNGEWASNGIYAYLGLGIKKNKIFQSVFDVDVNQEIVGFSYVAKDRSFYIPSGTHLSQIQNLLDNIPKALKLKSNDIKTANGAIIYNDKSIKFVFENNLEDGGESTKYIDDLPFNLTIRDFSYKIKFTRQTQLCPGTEGQGEPDDNGGGPPDDPFGGPSGGGGGSLIDCPFPELVLDKEILIYNSNVEFEYMKVLMNGRGQNASSMFRIENSSLTLQKTYLTQGLSSTSYVNIGTNCNVVLKDNAYSNLIANRITFSLIAYVGYGSSVTVEGKQKYDGGIRTYYLVMNLRGNLLVKKPEQILEGTDRLSDEAYFRLDGGTSILGGLDFTPKDQTTIKQLSEAFYNAGVTDVSINTANKTLRLTYNNGNDTMTFTGQ